MSCVFEMLRSRSWPRAAALALMSVGIGACSADTSRFSENPFAANSQPEATASTAQAAPVSRVESRPLAPQTAQVAPSHSGTSGSAAAGSGGAAGGKSMASHSARPSAAAPEATGSVTSKPAANANWSWDGGTAITVAAGETVDTIARRYGVPASVIIQANGISAPASIRAGQRLVIPRYQQSRVVNATPAARPATPAPVASVSPAGNAGVHMVAPGDTLSKIARLHHKPVAEIAKANNIQANATLNVGDRLVIPGVRTSAAKPNATSAVAPAKPTAAVAPKESEPVQSASVVTPAPEGAQAKDAVKTAEGTGALPKFRWPANGRVIAGYGPTTNGQQNDGINIALPENTPVKAAEDGVVAYAGNELKGYGNLVLVRHPNGYVTAYAHAKELLVKRGDQVKRGQVIARSGQTGNVNAPQLHFEIRKGASPLDPTRFLNGA
jgi:murein DD-endopeptidase MepM/ murein hydrolase activator NlpD